MQKTLRSIGIALCLLIGGVSASHAESSRSAKQCLAETIYHEARGSSLKGQIAVAQVVLRRVDHDEFADTICGVVKQVTISPKNRKRKICQFSWFCTPDLTIDEPDGWKRVSRVADYMLNDEGATVNDYSKGALYYINPHEMSKAAVKNFGKGKIRVAEIDCDKKTTCHWFYKDRNETKSNVAMK